MKSTRITGSLPCSLVFSLALSWALAASAGTGLRAQVSGHERVGMQAFRTMELTLSAGVDAIPAETGQAQRFSLQTSAYADFLLAGTWNISTAIPYSIIVASGRENRFPVIGAVGDPEVSLGFTSRIGSWRLGADLAWSHPMGISNPVTAEVFGFSSGSGSGAISLLARANRFLDPLSVGTSLALTCGLPGRERFGSGRTVWSAKAGLSLTEALNRNALLGLSLTQNFTWVPDTSGNSVLPEFRYGAMAGASITLTNGDASLRIGGSANIAHPSMPGSIHVIVSKSINIGRKP